MTYCILPLEKPKKQGVTNTQSHPIPKLYIFEWDGTEDV